MLSQAPRFWWSAEKTLAARLLWPAGVVSGAITAGRMRLAGRRVSVPVVCVGNFVVGGAGKTPAAIAVARKLIACGESPAFLSRGYGRAMKGREVLYVDPTHCAAREAGDEPLLLARVAPTFVAADRCAAADAAIRAGASVLVLDDGLQSPALFKNTAIAVVDGPAGVGNGFCVPAGPLRAPLASQWPAVSVLCVVGEGPAGSDLARQAADLGIPVLRAELRPDPAAIETLRGRRLYAFSGIGRPGKFFGTLEDHSLTPVGRRAFADHHPYGSRDQADLLEEAKGLAAELVTTDKDRVRLPADFPAWTLPVSLQFVDEAALDALIHVLMAGGISARP